MLQQASCSVVVAFSSVVWFVVFLLCEHSLCFVKHFPVVGFSKEMYHCALTVTSGDQNTLQISFQIFTKWRRREFWFFKAQWLIYRVSQEECARLREGVPYVKVYRYNPKHLHPKLNGYGDNGQRKVKASCGSKYCNLHSWYVTWQC